MRRMRQQWIDMLSDSEHGMILNVDECDELVALLSESGKPEWPKHDHVGILFTEEPAMYVDTGDRQDGVPGTIAYKVKDEHAQAIIAARKNAARYCWLRAQNDKTGCGWCVVDDGGAPGVVMEGDALDAALDEAMREDSQSERPRDDTKELVTLLIAQVHLVWWSVLRGDTPHSMRRMFDLMRSPAKVGELVVVTSVGRNQPKEDCIGWLTKVEYEPYGVEDGEPSGFIAYWTIERLTGGEIRWTNVQLLRVLRETSYDHIEPIRRDESVPSKGEST